MIEEAITGSICKYNTRFTFLDDDLFAYCPEILSFIEISDRIEATRDSIEFHERIGHPTTTSGQYSHYMLTFKKGVEIKCN